MRPTFQTIALLSLAVATSAAAQGGGAPPMPPAGQGAGASAPAVRMLLANTGELGLNDNQVTRLAAIARRSEARRTALRAAMDSNRRRIEAQPADTAMRRQFGERMRTTFDRERDQNQTDLRDAIAVLNADQQAKAWQMVARRGGGGARRGPGMRGGMRGGGRAMGMRPRGIRPPRDPMLREERPMRRPRELERRDGVPDAPRPMRRRPFEG